MSKIWDDEDADVAPAEANQWAGEDDDNVPDAWDAEPVAKPVTTAPAKVKKTKEEKIAEREAKRLKELEEREKRAAEEAASNSMTELQRQQISRKAELDMLGATFGDSGDKPKNGTGIDGLHPTTREEFNQLSQCLQEKLLSLQKSPHYVLFLEGLIRGVVANVDVDSLRKLSSVISTIANEKQKAEKGKPKQKKGAVKPNIKVAKGADVMSDMMVEGSAADIDYQMSDEDDFM